MNKKGGAYEMSSQCMAMFNNPEAYGLNKDEFAGLNFHAIAQQKVGGVYKKKKVKSVSKKAPKKTPKKAPKKEPKKAPKKAPKKTPKKAPKKAPKKTKRGGSIVTSYLNNVNKNN